MRKIIVFLLVLAAMGLTACKNEKAGVPDASISGNVTEPDWELPIDVAIEGTTDGETATPGTTVPDTTQDEEGTTKPDSKNPPATKPGTETTTEPEGTEPVTTQTTTKPEVTEPVTEKPTEKPNQSGTSSGAIQMPFIPG